MTKIIYTCPECAGTDVYADAYVSLNDPTDVRTFDASMICMDCDVPLKYVNTKEDN